MNKRCAIIIKEGMEKYFNLLKEVDLLAPFSSETLELGRFLTEEYAAYMKEYDPSDLVLLIASTLYRDNREDVDAFLSFHFEIQKPPVILIYSDIKEIKEEPLINHEYRFYFLAKDVYDLAPEQEFSGISINFTIFLMEIFKESILENQLYDHLSGSIRGIINAELLKDKNTTIANLHRELEKKKQADYLTGLYNREAFYHILERHVARNLETLPKDSLPPGENLTDANRRSSDKVKMASLVMVDIDHFKTINDSLGHQVGDRVLKQVGDLLSNPSIFRNGDIACRFGGEEFCLFLPGTDAASALKVTERLRARLKEQLFSGDQGDPFSLTLSMGITEINDNNKDPNEIFNQADLALYRSKQDGRDRVTIYDGSSPGAL